MVDWKRHKVGLKLAIP